ncbi:MAG TPA: hypothetical protein PKE47_01590, partial [Verrucomicrobiota bacterium]|nr:hypothetical protein [Verrucomicrobiota bacterium]
DAGVARGVLAARRASLAADDPALGDALAQLTLVLLAQRRFTEAEPPARETLAIRDQGPPEDWRRFVALSQWGGVLLGLGRLDEAGPPLREGWAGLKEREPRLPAGERVRLREAAERLLAFAETTGDADGAGRWRAELTALEAPAAGPAPSGEPAGQIGPSPP